MANYCEFCGSRLEPDALFCTVCGAKVEADETSPVIPVQPKPTKAEEASPEVAYKDHPSVSREQAESPAAGQAATASALEDKAAPKRRTFLAAMVAAVVLLGLSFGVWQAFGEKPAKQDGGTAVAEKPGAQAPETKMEPTQSPAKEQVALGSSEAVLELRTEATKAISDISAAGFSDAACKIRLPALEALAGKARKLGRNDLAVYWESLSHYLQACNAATKNDRAQAKVSFTKAAESLCSIPLTSLRADPTLRADVIGSIGSYLSMGKGIGLPDNYPASKSLAKLKSRLK